MHLPKHHCAEKSNGYAGQLYCHRIGRDIGLPVAEEASRYAEIFGNRVERIVDVGVAGVHRLSINWTLYGGQK